MTAYPCLYRRSCSPQPCGVLPRDQQSEDTRRVCKQTTHTCPVMEIETDMSGGDISKWWETHDRGFRVTLGYLVDKITVHLLSHYCCISQWPTNDFDTLTSTQMEISWIVSDQPEPVVFMSVSASTSGRINEEFLLLLFLHTNRDTSVVGEFQRSRISSVSFELFVWLISRVLLGWC